MPSSSPGPGRASRRRVGFVGHALAEYVLGAALVAVGLHVAGALQGVLLGVGSLLVVLNAVTDGPLGAVALVGRRGHHVADLVLVGLLLASPLTALGQLHVLGVVVAELVGLVLLRMERTTHYAKASAPAGPAGPAAPAGPAGSAATPVPAPPAPPALSGLAGLAGRAGAAVGGGLPGSGVRAGKVARTGVRNLGVVVGVTRRVARQQRARRLPPGGDRDAAPRGA